MNGPVQVTIRPMAAADLDAVLAIEGASFTAPWNRNQFLQELDSPVSCCLTALAADGAVAGYLCLMFAADECTVMDIAVAPAMRGQGVGRLLMDRTLEECRHRGSRHLHLEVRVSAAPAIALYRAVGFTEAGRRRRYYRDGEDAIVMSREIALDP
jgi:ribosomal-protein-alanine N-acetyltransferase